LARGTARAPAEQRRDEILRAAEACFAERGYHGTTIDHIAERCGLSKGAIYWYFPGKRELFLALFDRYRERLVEVRRSAAATASAPDGLRSMMDNSIFGVTDVVSLVEPVLEYMAHASRDEELRARFRLMYEDFQAIAVEQVERGVKDGAFSEVDAGTVARVLASLVDGLLMQKAAFPELDLPRALRDSVEIVLRGIERR
jgi:AcrR family transcriptional regulator